MKLSGRSKWSCGCTITQALLLGLLVLQLLFFYYLFSHHKFFQQSVYDLSGLVDSHSQTFDITDFDLERRARPDPVQTKEYTATFPVSVIGLNPEYLHASNKKELLELFGSIIDVDFPDLSYRSEDQIRTRLERVFRELPADGFDPTYKNPCWLDSQKNRACLPYAYILGQPKSGTSDLFVRLVAHDRVIPPIRKEVRWLTRGEFSLATMAHEENQQEEPNPQAASKKLMGPGTSIFSFTFAFNHIAKVITRSDNPGIKNLIAVDGGPHTLWWPTQGPDGAYLPQDIPPTHVLRLMQPNALFLVSFSDPIKRFYSDYHFLGDDLRPVAGEGYLSKSAAELHERAAIQVKVFESCVDKYITILEGQLTKLDITIPPFLNSGLSLPRKYKSKVALWFRASQMCACDRIEFARGGWGRLSIGLYAVHLARWLEHFNASQFLLLRLEDFQDNRLAYMTRVFTFLGLGEPMDWKKILTERHFNENHSNREPILPQTEELLRSFYLPYNEVLVQLIQRLFQGTDGVHAVPGDAKRYLWEYVDNDGERQSLRDLQVLQSRPSKVVQRRSAEVQDDPQHDDHHILGDTDSSKEKELTNDPVASAELMMQKGSMRLRGARLHHSPGQPEQRQEIVLTPEAFDMSGLPLGNHSASFFVQKPSEFYRDGRKASEELCAASFALDLPHLRYLLHTVGVPSTLQHRGHAQNNAFHCLANIYTMGEAHSHSHIFAELKGVETYLTAHIKPPLPLQLDSVSTRVILDSLETDIELTALWLLRAGVPFDADDGHGNTPLIVAANGGLLGLVKILVACHKERNVTLDAVDATYKRTALHFAAAQGHAEICQILLEAGSNMFIRDAFKVTARDIISNPGPISEESALRMGIAQRKARQIPRALHPELLSDNSSVGWKHGTGGWSTSRLAGYESDVECSIVDQYFAHEITGEEIFHKYLAHNAPVLIKGLIDDWEVTARFHADRLRAEKGHLGVQVSDIPYARKFGGKNPLDMSLGEYIDCMRNHSLPGDAHPWYVFKGHPIPSQSDESADTLVPYEQCPTPHVLQQAFDMGKGYGWGASVPLSGVTGVDKSERKLFVNAQWALGGEGTGAPVHFHNTAWNAVIYGAKKWVIHPPHESIMSNEQILQFVQSSPFMKSARTCTQLAGEVMIIPENYGHGVLNLQHSIAIATEFRYSLFRLSPQPTTFTLVPSFNNRAGSVSSGPPRSKARSS